MLPGARGSAAPFSHAVEADGWVLLTGQMPTDPAAPDAPLPQGIEAQTAREISAIIAVARENRAAFLEAWREHCGD